MLRKLVLTLAAGLALAGASEPAFADRGHRGGDRGHNRNWDRGRDHGRDHDRGRDRHRDRRGHRDRDWDLNIYVPYRSHGYYRPDYYRYREPVYYNAWGLAPYACRVDIEFDYWRGRRADIQIRRCADSYGEVYIVQGAQRLWRYR